MKSYIIVLMVLTLTGGGYVLYKNTRDYKEPVPVAVSVSDLQKKNTQESQEGSLTQESKTQEVEQDPATFPDELNIQLTFYSQAPFGNWDYPWQEACEEASALLVANAYYEHNWTREEFNDQILKLVDWQKGYFGTYLDTTAAQISEMLDKDLGLKSVIHDNPTFEDVEKALNKGHLIIMTFAGKELNNPYFTNGGPVYHALVVKGYKKDPQKVITADVGTRRGEDFVYSWSNIYSSLHDYAEPIDNGAKRMIEVLPPEGF